MDRNETAISIGILDSVIEGQRQLEEENTKNANHFATKASKCSSSSVSTEPILTSEDKTSDEAAVKMEQNCSPPPQMSESTPLYPVNTNSGKYCCSLLLNQLKRTIKLFFPSITFTKFFIQGSIPPLANNLVPLFFIGNIPNESALALAGQFVFISVIIEVIQEGIVNSLFHFVGRNYKLDRLKALQALKLCLAILLFLGGILTVLMILLNSQFVKLIDTPDAIVEATRDFLYISSFSYPLFLVDAALNSFLLITTSSCLIYAQICSAVLSFLCNFLLFGGQTFSLHWGVEQLGFYRIIQTSLSCANNFLFCMIIEKLGPWQFVFEIPLTKNLKANFKDLFRVSWGNFGDSAVRNFFYFVVTLKFINNLGETEIAAWNLLNSIVWGLLLIPSFTVANYAKVTIGHQGRKSVIQRIAKESFKCLTAWLIIVCASAYALWPQLAQFFGKSNQEAQTLSTKMLHEMGWIFIVFSFNNAMDSLFVGVGKTQFVFYQSLFTNLLVYFVPWILYLSKVIYPSYWLVIGLYIAGMLVDFFLTGYFSIRVWETIPD